MINESSPEQVLIGFYGEKLAKPFRINRISTASDMEVATLQDSAISESVPLPVKCEVLSITRITRNC